jgi:hypothetical protein
LVLARLERGDEAAAHREVRAGRVDGIGIAGRFELRDALLHVCFGGTLRDQRLLDLGLVVSGRRLAAIVVGQGRVIGDVVETSSRATRRTTGFTGCKCQKEWQHSHCR